MILLENSIPPSELIQQQSESIPLDRLSTVGLLESAVISDIEHQIIDRFCLLEHPFEAISYVAEMRSKMIAWQSAPSGNADEVRQYQNALELLQSNEQKIASFRKYLAEKFGRELLNIDDETTVACFYKICTNQLILAFNSTLLQLPEKQERVEALKSTLLALLDTEDSASTMRTQIHVFTSKLDNLLMGQFGQISIPNFGDGIDKFLQATKLAPTKLADAGNAALYVPHLKTFISITQGESSEAVTATFSLETKLRSKAFAGLGIQNPQCVVDNVTGEAYLINLYDGISGSADDNERWFSDILQHLRSKNQTVIKTHAFDPSYLLSAIDSGGFTIPHMGGFQVETKDIATAEPTFQYISAGYPYFFFIFDGVSLENRFPIHDRTHQFKGFHFIPEGLQFSDPDFLYCVVPSGLRMMLLTWAEAMTIKERARIFGNKNPSSFFISSVQDL